jgi:hypothetical protein
MTGRKIQERGKSNFTVPPAEAGRRAGKRVPFDSSMERAPPERFGKSIKKPPEFLETFPVPVYVESGTEDGAVVERGQHQASRGGIHEGEVQALV